ncbi:TMEM175 family protein [Streptomyces sp. ACA25]|uniref:TMEM175 family protein n=1 Tax=Streptomyces sp. ACA25 TaxID=3022596 RepID=UPI002307C474|nr:TMEM175 family protein [Streptomyces sp. ACA25]MDB1087589.1 TMEM175 family protein [Streptomyces sp. ACA25]
MDSAAAQTRSPVGAERLAALSDGVFAIALTLLVLDLSLPPGLDSAEFRAELHRTLPNLGAYALSFAVIAQYWRGHRQLLAALPSLDERVTALTLLGLALTALLPFPTSLIAEYSAEPLAVAWYAGNVAAATAVHLALLLIIHREGPLPGAAPVRRLDVADLALSFVVFLLSVPLAFVSPGGALLFWLLLIPLKVTIGHFQRRAARPVPPDRGTP